MSRKKWSHRTFAGSVKGGHSSGRVVAPRTYVCPVHDTVVLVSETDPPDGVAPRVRGVSVPIASVATIRATRGGTSRVIGHPLLRRRWERMSGGPSGPSGVKVDAP